MLDVVFIMLIFFIVTATFIKESGVEITRPKAATTVQHQSVRILVGLDAQNRIWVDRKQIGLSALRPLIERLRLEHPQSGAVIQADIAANTGFLVQVMDQLRLAGIEHIALASNQP
jgi:biopolymer transport protein ExbD